MIETDENTGTDGEETGSNPLTAEQLAEAAAASVETGSEPPAQPPPADEPAAQPANDIRLIRWIGEPVRKIRGRFPDGSIGDIIDFDYEPHREAPTPGASVRSIEPSDPNLKGLTRIYHWGPQGPFLAEMTASDWEILSAHPTGARFIDVTGDQKYDGRPRRRLDDPRHAGTLQFLKEVGRL